MTPETDKRVDELMEGIPLHDALNWCDDIPGRICACPGCVNKSRGVPITKAMWERWLARQFMSAQELEEVEADLCAGCPINIDTARRLFATIRLKMTPNERTTLPKSAG